MWRSLLLNILPNNLNRRTAAEQQAAVLAAKLEACADRVSRAEARVEQIEQQAAKAAQANEESKE